MNAELATTTHGSELVLLADQRRWTEAQVAALRQKGLENVPQADLDVYFHVAQRTGLDAFAGQIHLIGRKTKSWDPQTRQESWTTRYTIQTGIDGYRVTANRAAKREGDILEYDDAEWCGPDGQWTDVWVDQAHPPVAARVVLIRNGRRISGTAMFAEYVQTYKDKNGNILPNSMWQKMPAGQLAKCAEALAIRKAYPLDFAALYTDEEMGQADSPTPAAQQPQSKSGLAAARARRRGDQPVQVAAQAPAPLSLDSELGVRLINLLDEIGVTSGEERLAYVGGVVGRTIDNGDQVTEADAHATIAAIQQVIAETFPNVTDAELVEDGEQA